MPKLPVFATVGRAYSFVFANLGLVYRLCWFPSLQYLAIGFVQFVWLASIAARATPAVIGQPIIQAVLLLSSVTQMLFLSIALVALHRAILFDQRRRGTVLLFSMGRVELLFTFIPAAIPLGLAAIGFIATHIFGVTEGQRIPPSKEQGAIVLVVFLAIIAVGT